MGEPPTLGYESNQQQRPPAPHCPRCGTKMLQGVVLADRGGGTGVVGRQVWVEGEIRRRWLGLLRMPRGRRFEIIAFRCAGCGLIEHYSPTG